MFSVQARDSAEYKQQLANATSQLERLNKVWSLLHDDELFDGELGLALFPELYLPPDNPSITITAGMTREEVKEEEKLLRPHVRKIDFVLVAKTSAQSEEIAALAREIELLTSGPQMESEQEARDPGSDDRNLQAEAALSSWQVEDGWFVWSSQPEMTNTWIDLATGKKTADKALGDNRDFVRVTSEVISNSAESSAVNFYIDTDVLPALVLKLESHLAYFLRFDPKYWREAFLNEIRGVGGTLLVEEPRFDKELDASLVLKSFLIVTHPRHGTLRGLDSVSPRAMLTDYPTLDFPLSTFQYLAVNGEEYMNGTKEIQARYKRSMAFPSQEFLRGWSTIDYVDSQRVESNENWPTLWVASRVSDPDRFRVAQAESIALPWLEYIPGEEVEWDMDLKSDRPLWVRVNAPDHIESNRERLGRQYETMRKLMKPREEHFPDPEAFAKAQVRFEQEMQKELMFEESYIERLERPQGFAIGNWSVSSVDLDVEHLQAFYDNFGEPHGQLVELEAFVTRMQRALGDKPKLSALACHWSDGFWQNALVKSGIEYEEIADWDDAIRKHSSQLTVAQMQSLRIQRALYDHIDRFVLTITDDNDGFQINGVLTDAADDR